MLHWELAKQRLEDVFIFEEDTSKGNLERAVLRKQDLIDSIENKCDLYKKNNGNQLNEDTLRLFEIELKRHKTTLKSLKTAEKTKSAKEKQRAMFQQHSDIVRNVNASFFHDEL